MPDYNIVYKSGKTEDYLTPTGTWSTWKSQADIFSKAEAAKEVAKWQKLYTIGKVEAVPSGR